MIDKEWDRLQQAYSGEFISDEDYEAMEMSPAVRSMEFLGTVNRPAGGMETVLCSWYDCTGVNGESFDFYVLHEAE